MVIANGTDETRDQSAGSRKKSARVKSRRSGLKNHELHGILRRFRVPVTRFARHTGLSERHAQTLAGVGLKPGEVVEIPLWVEWILLMYDQHPEMRVLNRDLTLPVAHWLSLPDPEHIQRRRPKKEDVA